MKVFTTKQIRACDAYTIKEEHIESIDLMERASIKLFEWIALHYSKNEEFIVFAGPGNNGGDALALARLLRNGGFLHIRIFLLNISSNLSNNCQMNYDRLKALSNISIKEINTDDKFPLLENNEIVIDGVFGSGLKHPIQGYWAKLVNYLNDLPNALIAIDLPSGLYADLGAQSGQTIVEADVTLSFQFPKQCFFFADNFKYVGFWDILDIGLSKEFAVNEPSSFFYLQQHEMAKLLKVRNTFDHKGNFGHAFLVAGSYQKMGAAVLAAKGCLRAGVGLLTAHVPESGYGIMQTAVPEAMLCVDETEMNYCSRNILDGYSAIGIGPGVGNKSSMKNALKAILTNFVKPMVLDADALNILAEDEAMFDLLSNDCILTPHPGEFDRLTKKHESASDRLETQIALSKEKGIYIVLKGAFTSISTPEGKVYFNSTGNAGMATAGSGDVLTGIILSLLAQDYDSLDAALLGVYVHGLAGDIANGKVGHEALIASDIILNLGEAFIQLKAKI